MWLLLSIDTNCTFSAARRMKNRNKQEGRMKTRNSDLYLDEKDETSSTSTESSNPDVEDKVHLL